MFNLITQLIALIPLAAVIAFCYFRWIRPRAKQTTIAGQALLLLVALTFAGGFLGSFFWWMDLPQSFSWDLPPLASRMLASAGLAFAIVTIFCLQQPTQRRVRLVLILLIVYLLPIGLAAPLFHLDRFDFHAPITYAFFIIVLGMIISALIFAVRQPIILKDPARDSTPSNLFVRLWLSALAVLTFIWGLALFITDSGPSPLIWVWPGDLLTSRLISVMLFTIAAGALYSFPKADTARLMLWLAATYGLGLVLATAWNLLGGLPIKFIYLLVFGFVFLVSAFFLLLTTKTIARLLSGAEHA